MSDQSTIAARLAFNLIDRNTADVLLTNKAFISARCRRCSTSSTITWRCSARPRRSSRTRPHDARQEYAVAALGDHRRCAVRPDLRGVVTKIGEVHNKLGLEPRWYIGGYNFLVAGLVEAIARRLPAGRFDRSAADRKLQLQKAIIKAAMLDMDFAIAVYLDAGRRERHATLERLAGDFEQAIGSVVNVVSSAATELQASAQTMTAAAEQTAAQSHVVAAASEEARPMCRRSPPRPKS